MITCQHARQLFDRYLDGELSPSLQAELHAHQLSCSACQTELAMLEACGDVIMLDRRREPKLSDSFTDRVLMARRAQLASQPRRRNWGRTLVLYGSPMAAAASIALVLTLMRPTTPQRPTVKLGTAETVSEGVGHVLGASNTAAVRDGNLPTTQMPAAGFVDSGLASLVQWTTETAQDLKSGLAQCELLMNQMLDDTKVRLAAQEDLSTRRLSQPDRADGSEQDPSAPRSSESGYGGDAGGDLLGKPF